VSGGAPLGDGLLVIRQERIAFASAGVAAVLGIPGAALVGRPLQELLRPEDRALLLERQRRRLRGEPVPSEYELTVTGADGRPRLVELQATLDAGQEVVVRVRDLSDQAERRERLAALAAAGMAIQGEPDPSAILGRVRQLLLDQRLIGLFLRREGEAHQVVWSVLGEPLRRAVEAELGAPLAGFTCPATTLGAVTWSEGLAFGDDWQGPVGDALGPALAERLGAALAAEGPLRVAAVRIDRRAEGSGLVILLGTWLRRADLPALRLFGAQVAAALDAADAMAVLARRNAELEAVTGLALSFLDEPDAGAPRRLQAACAIVARTFEVDEAGLLLLDEATRMLRPAAWHGADAPLPAPALLSSWPLAERALALGAPVAGEDPGAGGAARSLLLVPVASRARRWGLLVLRHGGQRRFARADRTLAMAMGGGLAMALQNLEHHDEAGRRAEELALLHDVGRTLVASLEPQAVLDSGVANLARIVDAPAAYLALLEPDGLRLRIAAVAGPHPEAKGLELPFDPARSLAAAAMVAREPIQLEDAAADPRRVRALLQVTGARSALVVPLLVRDAAIGAVFIAEHGRRRRFSPQEVQRASAVANQLAVAVDNARAHARALSALGDLQHAQARLVDQERLAALGELSAVVAHEVRNPLGVIFNSVGALRRLLQPEGDARLLLDMVAEEADRLDRMVDELLDFARPSAPEPQPEPLERVVDDALAVALSRPHHGPPSPPGGSLAPPATPVEVIRHYAPAMPLVPLDARQARQVVVNLVTNALQAMPRGGRLVLRTRVEGEQAVLVLEDTGPGIPAEVQARIFEPFFTTRAAGTGLGLAVVKRLLDGHGATIAFESRAGQGTAVTVRFPLTAGEPVEMGRRIG